MKALNVPDNVQPTQLKFAVEKLDNMEKSYREIAKKNFVVNP